MPDFLPFAGIHYDLTRFAGDVGAVVAPPYDVIDEDQRAALEAADPHNSVRLILPREGAGGDRYRSAADTIAAWRADGILVSDPAPRFYGYRMDFEDEDGRPRHTQGVIGALALAETGARPSDGASGAATVLPHERTMPKAKSDRLALLRATRANLDPIWCLSLGTDLSGVLGAPRPALATCVDQDGVRHRVDALEAPEQLAGVADAVGGAPIVIADGHHRFETACAYRDERAGAGHHDPEAGRIMAFVVELTDDELCVRAIHRVLTSLGGVDLRGALRGGFDVTGVGPNTPEGVESLRRRMDGDGGLGLVDRDGLALVRPRPQALRGRLEQIEGPARAVDATLFETAIRPELPGVDVGYRNDAGTVAALVEKGAADAAILLRPVTVGQIRTAAFAGVRMPEKTSFFQPKPRTGMVLRRFDG